MRFIPIITLLMTGCSPEMEVVTYPPSLTDVRMGLAKVDPDFVVPPDTFIQSTELPSEQYTMPGEPDSEFKTDLTYMEDLEDPNPMNEHANNTAYSYGLADGDLLKSWDYTTLYQAPKQGSIGDCYFIAAISSVLHARSEDEVDAIKEIIRPVLDSSNRVKKYSVRFYDYKGDPFDVEVDAQLFRLEGKPIYARSAQSQWQDEAWVFGLIEKAYAQWRSKVFTGYHGDYGENSGIGKGYELIGNGGYAGDALQALTGAPANQHYFASLSDDELFSLIQSSLEFHLPIVAASNSAEIGVEAGFVAHHAYSIVGTYASDDGGKWIYLRNPWGFREPYLNGSDTTDDGLFYVRIANFRRNYMYIDIGSSADKGDVIAPAAIDDLTVSPESDGTVELSFTATGDDIKQGRAYKYTVQYSNQPFTMLSDGGVEGVIGTV